MPIQSRTDLLRAIKRLPDNITSQRQSYKDRWLRWLSDYKDPSRATPDRNAEFIYNALHAPEWIIWLAVASGVAQQLVSKASGAVDLKQSRMEQAAAVRRILPWPLLAHQLQNMPSLRGDKTQPRNPPWTRDELILALELYLRNPASPPGKNSTDVQELSATLNKLGRMIGLGENSKFRNANGVYMKMMNFRRFDPQYTASGKVGLTRGNRDEEGVWREFAQHKERLVKVANAIRQAMVIPEEQEALGLIDDGIVEAEEGRLLTRLHRIRERNRALVAQRKLKAMKECGCLRCEACHFDFAERYGQRGKGFIEAHHTKPVETLVEGSKTRLEDLALLCANCHRMVHAARPWLRIDELRDLLLPRAASQS